jgi:hypothetical protein
MLVSNFCHGATCLLFVGYGHQPRGRARIVGQPVPASRARCPPTGDGGNRPFDGAGEAETPERSEPGDIQPLGTSDDPARSFANCLTWAGFAPWREVIPDVLQGTQNRGGMWRLQPTVPDVEFSFAIRLRQTYNRDRRAAAGVLELRGLCLAHCGFSLVHKVFSDADLPFAPCRFHAD